METKKNKDLFIHAALVQRAMRGNVAELTTAKNNIEKIKSDIKFKDTVMQKMAHKALLQNATSVMREALSPVEVQNILERYLVTKVSQFFISEKVLHLTIASWSPPEIGNHTPPELIRYGAPNSKDDFHLAIKLHTKNKKIVWSMAEVHHCRRKVNNLGMETWESLDGQELQNELMRALLYTQTIETCLQLLAQRFYLPPPFSTDPI